MLKWIRRGTKKRNPEEIYSLFIQTYIEKDDDYDFDSVGAIQLEWSEELDRYRWTMTIHGTGITEQEMPPVSTLEKAQAFTEKMFTEFRKKDVRDKGEALSMIVTEWSYAWEE